MNKKTLKKKTPPTNYYEVEANWVGSIYIGAASICDNRPGGYGYVICGTGFRVENSGGVRRSTHNRMELMAVIMALKEISSNLELTIYTDSTYVQKGISEWIKNWKVNNWRSSSKKPVKNKDLWIELDEAVGSRKINWEWVKGHAGNEGNEKADELANQGVISMMREQ